MEMTLRGDAFRTGGTGNGGGLCWPGPGMIQRLDFGGFILLRPEVLSRYAAAVVRKVRKHPQELGCIREDELLAGGFGLPGFQTAAARGRSGGACARCWRRSSAGPGVSASLAMATAVLTFPSYFRRERKEQPSHPSVLVTYRFDGPADDIYATLVVRLHHTVAFESFGPVEICGRFQDTVRGQELGLYDGCAKARVRLCSRSTFALRCGRKLPRCCSCVTCMTTFCTMRAQRGAAAALLFLRQQASASVSHTTVHRPGVG